MENVPGKDLRGLVILDSLENGSIWHKYKPTEVILGNEAMLDDCNVKITNDEQKLLKKWKLECKSVVIVAIKSSILFKDERFHLTLVMVAIKLDLKRRQ